MRAGRLEEGQVACGGTAATSYKPCYMPCYNTHTEQHTHLCVCVAHTLVCVYCTIHTLLQKLLSTEVAKHSTCSTKAKA
jgi:hypothetical protein